MDRIVVVRTAGAAGYENEVEVRGHRLRADEPAAAGGTDRGPAPSELLMAALGACTSITLRMYAARKGWDLRSVEVRVSRPEAKVAPGEKAVLHRTIRMEGDLDAEKRARLVEVAGRCPVSRALEEGVRLVTAEDAG